MSRIVKIMSQVILILFFSLFLTKYTNEYNENRRVLTEEAIIEYEQDLREGKDILEKNYIPEERNYNNKAARAGRKVSSLIEKVFHKGFDYLMRYLNYLQG